MPPQQCKRLMQFCLAGGFGLCSRPSPPSDWRCTMSSVLENSTELTRTRHAEGMAAYCREGMRLAQAIGNRGPVRFDAAGRLHPDILSAYWKHGFYIFEGVIAQEEIEELRRD